MTINDEKLVAFAQWADVVGWITQNKGSRRAQFTYYRSPDVHDDGAATPIDCKIVMCNVNGKADYRVRVSPSLMWSAEFDPFEADASHLPFFFRGEHTTLRPAQYVSDPQAFNLWSLREPDEGPVLTCVKCHFRYRALPFQSRRLCKDCEPPKQLCKHGVTNFEPCPECKKVTGADGLYVAPTPIRWKRE